MEKQINPATEKYRAVLPMATRIAEQSGVSRDYVSKILCGRRAIRSERAKLVAQVAERLLNALTSTKQNEPNE